MSIFNRKKILITHDGIFHADDIFATATLSLFLKGSVKIIRTRDESMFKKGDYVYDVGGIYDPMHNRFDHHQQGGAGVRENSIPYAAFGLVWKTFGEKICGDIAIAKRIDESLVQAIDADDNGIDLITLKTIVAPYFIQDMFSIFRPSYTEEPDYDAPFLKMIGIAREILLRTIRKTKDALKAESAVRQAYETAKDKRLIILNDRYPWADVLGAYPEPLYVVFPRTDSWGVLCVSKAKHSFENRKPLPEAWAGKHDQEMAEVSGVSDATFCHNGRFLAVAKSKEGAIALAEKALL